MTKRKKYSRQKACRSNMCSKTALKKKLVYLDSSELRPDACKSVSISVNIIVNIVLLTNFEIN
jgi:hypothetical protein